jgi:hypothetical protein
MHVYTHTCMPSAINQLSLVHVAICIYLYICIYIHTQIQEHTHQSIHKYTHTHTNTRTYTRTYIHTNSQVKLIQILTQIIMMHTGQIRLCNKWLKPWKLMQNYVILNGQCLVLFIHDPKTVIFDSIYTDYVAFGCNKSVTP